MDPDPHMQIYDKMEAKDVRLFKILINNSEALLITNFFVTVCVYSYKKYTCFKENYFEFFLSILIVVLSGSGPGSGS